MQSNLSPRVSKVGPSTNSKTLMEDDPLIKITDGVESLKIQSPNQKSRKKKSKRRGNAKTEPTPLDVKGVAGSFTPPQEESGNERADLDEGSPKSKQKKVSLAEFRTALAVNELENEEPTRILWVGNIAPIVTQDDILNEFGQYGTIDSLRILHERFCAFINFTEVSSAEEAKKNLNGSILGGQYIVINYRKTEPTSFAELTPAVLNTPSSALWIGNISEELSEAELLEEFQQYGSIANVRLLKHKTCAFVNFVKVSDAVAALNATQGKVVGKTALKVNFGKPLQNVTGGNSKSPTQILYAPVVPAAYYTGYPVMHMDPSYHYMNYGGPPLIHSAPIHSEMMSQYMGLATPNQCEICRSSFKDTLLLDCNHSCCGQCASRIQYSNQTCPFCQQHVSKIALASYSPYVQYG